MKDREVALPTLHGAWALATLVGFPSLLFACGYLVYKGHLSFLDLPSSLLMPRAEQLVFTGGQWVVLTVELVVWNWVAVSFALLACLAFALRRRAAMRFMHVPNVSDVVRAWALILAMTLVCVVETNLIAVTSGALTDEKATPGQLQHWLESSKAYDSRVWIYRLLSAGSLVGVAGLVWVLRISRAQLPAMLSYAAIALCTFAILN